MDYSWHIKEILRDVKDGIDKFNLDAKGLRAEYPPSVTIEYCGVNMCVPFTVNISKE